MHPNYSTQPSSPRLASPRSSSGSSLSSSPFGSGGRPRTYYKSSPESLHSFLATRMSSPAPSTSSSIGREPERATSDGQNLTVGMRITGEGADDNDEGASEKRETRSIEQDSDMDDEDQGEERALVGTECTILEKHHDFSTSNYLSRAQRSSSHINLTNTSTRSLHPCSSCGAEPSLSTSNFVSLVPCSHILCPACVTQLVNGVSNDPPRQGMCFADGLDVESFEGVAWQEGTAEEVEEKPIKANTVKGWVKRTWLGDSVDTVEWRAGLDTPPVTPGSMMSYRSSPSYGSNTRSLEGRGVVRVDNIPWDIKTAEVAQWIPTEVPTLSLQLAPISILCSRSDGRTLSQLYIELPSVEAAQKLVRLAQGKKLKGRPVSVVLASMSELLEHIFPDWLYGFEGADAREPWREGQVLSIEDVEGLIELCKMESPHILKVPERVFYQVLAILLHFPFHQESTYDSKLVALLAKGTQVAIDTLLGLNDGIMKEAEAQSLLKILFNVATTCPAFGEGTKLAFYRLMGVDPPPSPAAFTFSPSRSSAPTTPPSSPPSQLPYSLRSPTLDRVRNSPSSPSPSPLRYYTSPPPPLEPGAEPTSPPSPSPMRRPFRRDAMRRYPEGAQKESQSESEGGEGKREEEMRRFAEEMGIELELVRAVAKGLKMG